MRDYHHVLCRLTNCLETDPGRKWRAVCPIHKGGEAKTRTLSLGIGREGRLIMRCFAGCQTADSVKELGLTMADMFPDDDPDPRDKPKGQRKHESKRKIVATYDYCDEGGQLLFQVVRFEPKSFAQRRPCPAANGLACDGIPPGGPKCNGQKDGWHWLLGDVRRVLYRLPELLAKPDWPVVVVEGEKDVGLLSRVGLLATCNPGGVGCGWLPEYTQSLAGRRVAIIPDGDSPGQKHAEAVAGSLIWGGAASVRIVALPQVDSPALIKDVSEWWDAERAAGVDERRFKELLTARIKAAPEWRAAPAALAA